jgi:oligopeptide transport system substrate-binding protein
VQLARHFTQAGEVDKSVKYLLQAGDQARALYAHQEAIDHYQRALEFLKDQHEYERAARTLMKLGLTYHTAFDFDRSREAYQEGFALWQRLVKSREAAFPPQTLKSNGTEPVTLDPTLATDTDSIQILNQLFSGLITLGHELEVLPNIASSWEVTGGGLKYIFHLREDVVWSDGTPITAADFEYAWKRVLDPATKSDNARLLEDVKGAQAFHQGQNTDPDQVGVHSLDDHTLMVELEEPVGYFLYLLNHLATFPLPRHIVERYGNRWTEIQHLVSNGPYLLEAWHHGECLSFKRNPLCHDRFKGNVNQVEYFVGMGIPRAVRLYEQGKLDVVGFFWPAGRLSGEAHAICNRHADDHISFPINATRFVGFDPSQAPFDDRRVRRAFVMAIDREWWAYEVTRGNSLPGTGGFVPPGMPGHSPGIGLPYDPDHARQLLAEAGYPNGNGFPLITTLVTSSNAIGWDLLLQRWHTVLGVEITSEVMEWTSYLDRLRAQLPPIFLMAWEADYPDPDTFLRVAILKYFEKWKNEEYHQLEERLSKS